MHMDVGGTFRIDAFPAARVGSGALRQIAFTNIDWQPPLMFIHLRVDEVAWLIGCQLWMARVNLVDVHLARCASPSAGEGVGHVPVHAQGDAT